MHRPVVIVEPMVVECGNNIRVVVRELDVAPPVVECAKVRGELAHQPTLRQQMGRLTEHLVLWDVTSEVSEGARCALPLHNIATQILAEVNAATQNRQVLAPVLIRPIQTPSSRRRSWSLKKRATTNRIVDSGA